MVTMQRHEESMPEIQGLIDARGDRGLEPSGELRRSQRNGVLALLWATHPGGCSQARTCLAAAGTPGMPTFAADGIFEISL